MAEIWDIPGDLRAQDDPMMPNFFDAAVMCFNVENDNNLERMAQRVSVSNPVLLPFHPTRCSYQLIWRPTIQVASRAACQSNRGTLLRCWAEE